MEVFGSYRFDDPENQVGIETHLVRADGAVYQLPLTYRNEPLEGAESAFVGETHHSELGTRFVYDGLGDGRFILMLAAVSMTGQGEALGLAAFDGRWYIAPANVRITGGGWNLERVPVDGFEIESDDAATAVLANDRFEMTYYRKPIPGPQPPIGLTANWDGQSEPIVVSEIRER